MNISIDLKIAMLKNLRFTNNDFIPELGGPKFTHVWTCDSLFVFDQMIAALLEFNQCMQTSGFDQYIVTNCDFVLTAHTYTDDEGVLLKLSGIDLPIKTNGLTNGN